jgi:hypothetical protein
MGEGVALGPNLPLPLIHQDKAGGLSEILEQWATQI